MKTSTPEELGFSSERLDRIGTVMQRYLDEGKLAGIVTLVARRGRVVHFARFGYQDIEAGKPMEFDTLFRIYSMTKPITSVALMMLFEQGLVRLADPVSRFIPEFKDIKVLGPNGQLLDPVREVTIHDLLTHTSGLSYGDFEDPSPGEAYAQSNLFFRSDITNQELVRGLAALPLLFQPGTMWHYSAATDVLGHVIELISDMSLGDFFKQKIFDPLGMVDTAFRVPAEKVARFATLYGLTEDDPLGLIGDDIGGDYFNPRLESGGGGLVSTAADYLRFAQMVLNKGELDGVRLLAPKTVELMTTNHLPPALLPMVLSEPMPGLGFGLGFSVLMDLAQAGIIGSVGSHGWGGWATTRFWVDPQEQLVGIFLTQYIPSDTYLVADDFRTLVYQALVD